MSKLFGSITLQEMSGNRDLTRTVLERVKRACEFSDGRFTLDAVVNGLAAGELSIWGVLSGADLTAVSISRVTPWESGLKVFEILMLGGPEHADMLPFLDRFEQPARKEGCAKIRLYGRTSWGNLSPARRGGQRHRLLPKDWRVAAVVYEKDLAPDVSRQG